MLFSLFVQIESKVDQTQEHLPVRAAENVVAFYFGIVRSHEQFLRNLFYWLNAMDTILNNVERNGGNASVKPKKRRAGV